MGNRPQHALWLMAAAWFVGTAIGIAQEPDFSKVPGVVVHHQPQAGKIYVGSPGLVRVDESTLVAKCDEFGPGSTEYVHAVTHVFRSTDNGATWSCVASIDGLFWSNVFLHGGMLYQIGTTHHHGNLVILQSADHGITWSSPENSQRGLLREGEYHTAPMPMVEHQGRLWRAVEEAGGGKKWGIRYRAMMMSAPLDADLLDATSWEFTPYLAGQTDWLDGKFGGWLEGNAVVDPQGRLVNLLRVEVPQGGIAALAAYRDENSPLGFDPKTDFISLPGGAKKFTVRFDATSGRYWSLVNDVPDEYRGQRASLVRNRMSLVSSADLRHWRVERKLLEHPDVAKHAFQYPDWIFDGDNILALVRTAFDDGMGGAHRAHDANLLTFHVVKRFRDAAE